MINKPQGGWLVPKTKTITSLATRSDNAIARVTGSLVQAAAEVDIALHYAKVWGDANIAQADIIIQFDLLRKRR